MRTPYRRKSNSSSIIFSILIMIQLCDYLYFKYSYSLAVISAAGKLNGTSGQFLIVSAFKINQENKVELVRSGDGKWTLNFNDFYFNYFVYRFVDKLRQQEITNLLRTLREDKDANYKKLLKFLSTIADKMSFEKEMFKMFYKTCDKPLNEKDTYTFDFRLKNIYDINLFAGIKHFKEKEKIFLKITNIASIYHTVLGTNTLVGAGEYQTQYFYDDDEFLLYEKEFLEKYNDLKTKTISESSESTPTSKAVVIKNGNVEIVVVSVTICLLIVGIVIYFFRGKIFKWHK